MILKEILCIFGECGLILENPVTLLCGNTLCRQHLDGFETKFKCPFCHKQHSVPEEGFFVNEEIDQKINSFYQSDSLRKEVKESLTKLDHIIYDYEKIDPEGYVFDYFGEVLNKIDLHREEKIEEVKEKSQEMIKELTKKEQKCKSNQNKLEKVSLENLKPNDLPFWIKPYLSGYSLRVSKLKENQYNDFLSKLNEKIRQVQTELKSFAVIIIPMEARMDCRRRHSTSSFKKWTIHRVLQYREMNNWIGPTVKNFGIMPCEECIFFWV